MSKTYIPFQDINPKFVEHNYPDHDYSISESYYDKDENGNLIIDPEFYSKVLKQANKKFEQKKFPDAIKFFEYAAKFVSDEILDWNKIGESYFLIGKYKNAIVSAKKTILKDQSNKESLKLIALSFDALGLHDYSRKYWDKVQNLETSNKRSRPDFGSSDLASSIESNSKKLCNHNDHILYEDAALLLSIGYSGQEKAYEPCVIGAQFIPSPSH